MYFKQGDQLHIVSSDPNMQPCGIKDTGLDGLQDNFSLLHRIATTDLQFGRWGDLFEQLASPQFWEYQASQRQWTQSSPRKFEQPQGEIQAENIANEDGNKLDIGALKAKSIQTKCKKVVCRLER